MPSSLHKLIRSRHIKELLSGLCRPLPGSYQKWTPLQTWCIYWITHSLALMEQNDTIASLEQDVIDFIVECIDPIGGGYGGGPGQISHLATSYAAVNSLITMSTKQALQSIDRKSLLQFVRRMKQPDGSFTMHDGGEIDTRASYCAITLLKLLNLQSTSDKLLDNCAEYILACQTYEGGFGSVPGAEAHGGYTFCSVAALFMLGQLHRCDIDSLLRWLTNRQMSSKGGFNGRSNKLVDSCYSFWQGALFPILHNFLRYRNPYYNYDHKSQSEEEEAEVNAVQTPETPEETDEEPDYDTNEDSNNISNDNDLEELDSDPKPLNHTVCSNDSDELLTRSSDSSEDLDLTGLSSESDDTTFRDLTKDWLFDRVAMQDYILTCQDSDGLIKDRPDSAADFYHTCYALSGLSVAQHALNTEEKVIGGHYSKNLLARIHPLFNLTVECIEFCVEHFRHAPQFD